MVSRRRHAAVQRHEGLRRVAVDARPLTDKKSTPFGDVHSSTRTGAVFSPDGRWVAYATTEGVHHDDLCAALPGHTRRQAPAPAERLANPNIRCGRRTRSNSSTIRAPVSSSPSASRRNRPSASGTRWPCRVHFPELPQAFEDRTTSPEMAGSCPLSPLDNRRPEGPRLRRSRWCSTGSKN